MRTARRVYLKNVEMEARIVDSRRIIVYNWSRNESGQVPDFPGKRELSEILRRTGHCEGERSCKNVIVRKHEKAQEGVEPKSGNLA